jgi:4-hydroxy-3-methylbut-2-enyl diphosphate reductase
VGITSGASTPEELVQGLIERLLELNPQADIEVHTTVEETVEFKPPRDLIALAMAKG